LDRLSFTGVKEGGLDGVRSVRLVLDGCIGWMTTIEVGTVLRPEKVGLQFKYSMTF